MPDKELTFEEVKLAGRKGKFEGTDSWRQCSIINNPNRIGKVIMFTATIQDVEKVGETNLKVSIGGLYRDVSFSVPRSYKDSGKLKHNILRILLIMIKLQLRTIIPRIIEWNAYCRRLSNMKTMTSQWKPEPANLLPFRRKSSRTMLGLKIYTHELFKIKLSMHHASIVCFSFDSNCCCTKLLKGVSETCTESKLYVSVEGNNHYKLEGKINKKN
jgi:hypothetical protein